MKIIRHIPSEATIQAELYIALKAAGMRPILEQVMFIDGGTQTGRRKKIRVDVMILDENDNAFAAIEVKNCGLRRGRPDFARHKQHGKYTSLGLPFRYCVNMGEIASTVAWAQDMRTRLSS